MESEKQVITELTNKLADAKKHIAELESKIQEFEKNEIAFPLRLWVALEAILEKDYRSAMQPKQIKVINKLGENETILIAPHEVICIATENKGRRKIIYLKQNEIVTSYFFNNNLVNFTTLCELIDPFNRYLIKVSKSAVVNAGYYSLTKKRLLQLNEKSKELLDIRLIKISEGSDYVQNFLKIKHGIEYYVSLQKRVLGYKFSHDITP